MDMLSDVVVCTRELASERATDRKKNIEKLKHLIQKSSVTSALDKNSDIKHAGGKDRLFTWDDIVKGVFYYINIETDVLRKGKEAHTAATRANREKRKQEISGTLKFVIKQADKRGARLRSTPILEHIKEALVDEYTCTAYGLDYSNIILKCLLSVRKYWTEMNSNVWHELLTIYCKLYLSGECTLDTMLLSRVIYSLVHGACRQCDVRPKRLLSFFGEVFRNIRHEKSLLVTENLLKATNVFVRSIAENSRVQICKLGEDIIVSLLYLWNSRPSTTLKVEIVEFLRMQMSAHHPHGAQRGIGGAFAVDWDSWMSSLRKLYDVVYSDLQEMKNRTRFSAGVREIPLTEGYVELITDLCNQIFANDANMVEVTQIEDASQDCRSVKKRRLESGWSAVLDILTSAGHSQYIIPWLQLLTRLLQKYPQNFPSDKLYGFLDVLAKLLREFKKNDVMHYVLYCIRAYIEVWNHFPDDTAQTCIPLINMIWNSALRMIYFHHAEAASFQLLTSIVRQRLIQPSKDLWSIFFPSITTPFQESINFLLTYVENFHLPENHKAGFLIGSSQGSEGTNEQYPLRKQLFDWLTLDRENCSESFPHKVFENPDPETKGQLLVMLLLKSQWKYRQSGKKLQPSDENGLENLYSETCFSFYEIRDTNILKEEVPDVRDTSHLTVLLKHVEDKLREEFMIIMEMVDGSGSQLDILCWEMCMLIAMLRKMLEFNIVEAETLNSLGIVSLLKDLLTKVGSTMEVVFQKEGAIALATSLSWLKQVLSGDCTIVYNSECPKEERCVNKSQIVVARLLRSLFPSKILDILLGIVKEKVTGKARSNGGNFSLLSQSSSRGRCNDDLDDMDIEFESQTTNGDDFDEVDDDIVESQEMEDQNQPNQECGSIIDPAVLTEQQKIQVDVIHVLALWCGYDSTEAKQMAKYDMTVDPGFVKSRLLQCLSEENFDSTKVVDLHIMKILVETLSHKHQNVKDESLLTLISALRVAAKVQRHDQGACCLCVTLLGLLVPRLRWEDDMQTKILQECRQLAVTLLSAFWNLLDGNLLVTSVRLALVECVAKFLLSDPKGEWTDLSVKKEGGRVESHLGVELLGILCDPSLSVRLAAAKVVTNCFKCDGVPAERQDQDRMFDKIYEEIMVSLDIQGKLSAERIADEKNNRTVSSLCTLGNILCVSPPCEKKALFAMCQLIRERNIEIDRVEKVVENLALKSGFKEGRKYMECHLPYLIHQWLSLNYPVKDFPYQILFCSSQVEFYRTYYQTLIPELMLMKDLNSAKEISKSVKEEWTFTLKKCIPQIVVQILPLFAASGSGDMAGDKNVKRRMANASAVYDLLSSQLTKEVVENTISGNLDEIVVNILRCLYDPEEDEFIKTGNMRNLDPEPNPPFFNMFIIQSTLDYLTRSFSGSSKTLVDVLAKTQDSIQVVLLDLATDLTREHRLHEKRRVLQMYCLFSRMLLSEFQGQLGGCRSYVLRELIHRLLYLIKAMLQKSRVDADVDGYISNIGVTAIQLLKETCTVGVDVCPQEIEKYLMMIVCGLIPVVQHGGALPREALEILKMLIITNKSRLTDAIKMLDPFPEDDEFEAFSQVYYDLKSPSGQVSLRQYIEDFLGSVQRDLTHLDERKEGFLHLARKLASSREEILPLVEDCKEKGSTSLLGQFVSQLIGIARSASCREVKVIMATCLGEIGPVDLFMLSLPQQKKEVGILTTGDIKNNKHMVIFQELGQYLIGEDMGLVRATSSTLKTMLCTEAGSRFINHYKTTGYDLLQYLHPFTPRKKGTIQKPSTDREDLFMSLVDHIDLWIPPHSTHQEWIQALTCTLITSGGVRDELMSLLEPVCTLKTSFCELLLPYLIHNILEDGDPSYQEVLSLHISQFFMQHCSINSCERSQTSQSNAENKSICMNRDALNTMLRVVHHLRLQDKPQDRQKNVTVWDNNFWLDLNYLHLAKASLFCSAPFSAIMYAEIWCNAERLKAEADLKKKKGQHSQDHSQVSDQFTQDTSIESLSSLSQSTSVNIQELLLEAYRQIGEPDGVYGCGAGKLADTTSRLKTYEHEGKWDKAAVTYDIEKSNIGKGVSLGMLQAIQKMGAQDWLDKSLKEAETITVSPEIRELQFQAAWKSGQWNMENNTSEDDAAGFHESLCSALTSLNDKQFSAARSAVRVARLQALESLGESTIESSCRGIYPLLSDLQCVSQVEYLLQYDLNNPPEVSDLIQGWDTDLKDIYADFDFLEPVLQARCAVLKTLNNISHDRISPQISLQHQLISLVKQAVQANRHQIAERAICELKVYETTDLNLQFLKMLEEARFYWLRQELDVAKHLMKTLISRLEKLQHNSLDAAKLYPLALSIYGNWLAETHSETRNVILEEYLVKPVSLLEEMNFDDDTCLEAYLSLARFSDGQYQNIINYMKSSTYEAKQNLMKKAQAEMAKMQPHFSPDELLRDRYYRTLSLQSQIDQSELDNMERDKSRFLQTALENYLKCLRCGDKHDLRIFRLASLWFSNSDKAEVNNLMKGNLPHIKSYKFLSLMYQLCARMDTKLGNEQSPMFQQILNEVIERTSMDHPHHTLWCVLALAHAKKDEEIFKQPSASSRRGGQLSRSNPGATSETEGRIEAAKNMINRLKSQSSRVAAIVKSMETLCIAYIQLANIGVQQHKTSTKPIPLDKRLMITQIKDLHNVAMPTANIQVDPSCEYRNFVSLKGFEATFKLAGGINLPKIITCMGSDGVGRRQLVKGRDDLRQDAVMQQFFSMVNSLLMKEKETHKRGLSVRQYKVIPLSQCSGVLEWCEGTLPLGMYLTGGSASEESKGAHRRYRPYDISFLECRKAMASCATSPRTDAGKKLKVFLEICQKFQPVFRYFFMEHFPVPSDWFERRIAYKKSVATTSIVGYILGLGDRHVQNILVDINTAEFVHIDLGVAFEQGHIMPTPETVPFRLTRDIVDGMGVSGVEGVFRRCCEKTMEVMHQNSEALLTIVEVLLYDPLNNWTMSPHKAVKLQASRDRADESEVNTSTSDILNITSGSSSQSQGETEESVNKLAERVLLRLHQKLQGIEDGVQLSVEGQVNHLIQEARDPKNLSRIFVGWQPYL